MLGFALERILYALALDITCYENEGMGMGVVKFAAMLGAF
jgi:hypothetical protein